VENKQYYIKIPTSVRVEYDKQNDTLYVYFNTEEIADEEVLDEEGGTVLGFRDGRLILIQINKFSEKINSLIL